MGKLYESQKIALLYFSVAIVLFGAQLFFGLIAAYQYINPDFLYGILPFSVTRMLHINAMVVWLLMGFIGGIYWLLPSETGRDVVGAKLGKLAWFLLTAAVGIVVLVYLFKQIGKGDIFTLWFITEGREYIEAPRWADLGIVAVMLIIYFNVAATVLKAGKITGLLGVLLVDLLALAGLYVAGMFFTPNITHDQFWWWWVVHLWVEATWEVLVGVLMGYALMTVLGTPRRIVEGWLYLEVLLVFGTGILGLGHHYYWIGTPEYWLGIGGFFSSLEPLPLVAMIVHAVYDAGVHKLQTVNRPALFWIFLQAFGNFFGAGVWGFMHTLPQINLYSHGTQMSASHGHLAFFGAYVATNVALIYIALQHIRAPEGPILDSKTWKVAYIGMIVSMVGMVGALLVAGFAQTFFERAVGGATWQDFITAQMHPWVSVPYLWRFGFGVIFFLSYLVLLYDLATIGKKVTVAEVKPA
ncbi:nitric oxide reductase NorB subunit apoprotein [Hydrogenivirga caldilitoris]|uniref:Nitric oxide reductase NorB subunit apoprotein n=1 Tax=Hydrogenivirga caldilitoris TaxID=246264 RepID=A0A497XUY5_9AQUI|nr:cbb3-type cytochrome c oxidase subunit I [Hydrogenivirga caldilitoris]RLJ70962.1 nitric oxide reductase NorB subunit apoprotein [Hydrogenivirga caldilitoris]